LSTKVSSKYLAISGIVDEVGGKILETSNRKTTIESNTDIVSVIFSPESVGRKNTAILKNAINTVGMISTTV
uniref:KH_dom_type_1 domain-containing protein n=1 Tax=Brugia timori TaxID=42155 RepID=A0A0R3QIK8_9BILA